MQRTCLNLGCGNDILQSNNEEQWINIDNYVIKTETVKGNIENLSSLFKPETIDYIRARDVLEHLSHLKTQTTLRHWFNLLKTGGKMWIRVPDMKKQAECLLNGTWSPDRAAYMLYAGQEYEGNFHYAGFTADSLSKKLIDLGMSINKIEFEHGNLTNHESSSNANLIIEATK